MVEILCTCLCSISDKYSGPFFENTFCFILDNLFCLSSTLGCTVSFFHLPFPNYFFDYFFSLDFFLVLFITYFKSVLPIFSCIFKTFFQFLPFHAFLFFFNLPLHKMLGILLMLILLYNPIATPFQLFF